MARKGKEIQLQQEIETQEEWEDMLSKEGLCVVDVFQDWAGPVTPLVPNLRRLKNELGDDLLKFFVAKADTIDALEKYRGRCEPCFLFYAGGVLVSIVRGANAPLILRTITEQLAQEHKVLDGQAERKEIKDTMIAQLEEREKQKEEEEEEPEALRMKFHGEIVDFGDDIDSSRSEPVKEVAVVIIKPDAVQSGKADEIMKEMKNRGIEILREEERNLTEEEVKNVYTHLQDEPFFDDLVAYMTSSPCIVLAITKGKTGENVIEEFRDLIGPKDVEKAKEEAPQSLRAKYGSEKFMNAVHGSDTKDTAARELAFFFPDFVAPKVEGKAKVQRTLALIRPDAYKLHKDEILDKVQEAGFKVAMSKEIHFTKQQAEEFYKEHKGQEYFEELTTRMSSGPMLALALAREDAVTGWREVLGPTLIEEAKKTKPESLRAQFSVEGAKVNMLHGSDSEEAARKELEYFFPVEQTVAVIKPDAYGTKDEIIQKIHEAGFRIAARKETVLSKEIAEEFYADHKDKEFYNDLIEHMTSGPTYFMVLSKEGAVDGWRSLIGPTDPAKAKQMGMETLRGLYGTDTLRNAVHGSSNPEHAKATIAKIFGELYFNKDGSPAKEEPISEEHEPLNETAPEYVDKEKEPKKEEKKAEEKPAKAAESKTEKPAEEKAETKEEKPPSPEPQVAETKAEETPQAKSENKTKGKTNTQKKEPKPDEPEQKQEVTEEPPKVEAEPVKTEEEPPKTEEEPAKTEEPPKTEEPAKTEEPPKTEEPKAEEPPKTEEPKAEETPQTEQKTEETKPEEPPAQE